jgi:hypothetical protein
MPVHFNSFIDDEKNDILVGILSSDLQKAEDIFVTKDKNYIHSTKYIFDRNENKKIGKVVFTIKAYGKESELLDVDIVLLSKAPIKLKILDRLESSSEANEYYDALAIESEHHFQIETVNRYTVEKNNISNTVQAVYISAFPFQLNVFDNIKEINKEYGFEKPIKVGGTDFEVNGYSEDFVGCGGMFTGNFDDGCSFIIGKVKSISDITAVFGEKTVNFTIIQLDTAIGVIPVAVSRKVFDLKNLQEGKLIAMLADLKADFLK